MRHDAAFYFGVNQEDADAAREVFPHAVLIGTGNPLREAMAFPKYTRAESRAKLDIDADTTFVLAPGGKCMAVNVGIWSVLIDALKIGANRERKFQLILAFHPGDRTDRAVDADTHDELKLYEDIVKFSPVPTRIVRKDEMTTSEMVPGADLIFEFGSSIGIEAAYNGIPVISCCTGLALGRLKAASGSDVLEAVEDGISEGVPGYVTALGMAVAHMLTPAGFAQMRARQEIVCPKPKERGETVRRMADALESVMEKTNT